jgi:hypothetical protein
LKSGRTAAAGEQVERLISSSSAAKAFGSRFRYGTTEVVPDEKQESEEAEKSGTEKTKRETQAGEISSRATSPYLNRHGRQRI